MNNTSCQNEGTAGGLYRVDSAEASRLVKLEVCDARERTPSRSRGTREIRPLVSISPRTVRTAVAGLVHGCRGFAWFHTATISTPAPIMVVESARQPRLCAFAGWQLAGWRTAAVDLEHESLVFEREETSGEQARLHGSPDRGRGNAIDLDHVFPPHNPGDWPAGLSLRREDRYDDRGC